MSRGAARRRRAAAAARATIEEARNYDPADMPPPRRVVLWPMLLALAAVDAGDYNKDEPKATTESQ